MGNNRRLLKSNRLMNNSGFSLLELLVSIIILILIMVPLMHNFIRSAKINNNAEKLEAYGGVATDALEEIKAMSQKDLLNNYGKSQAASPNSFGLMIKAAGGYEAFTYDATNDANKDKYYFGLVRQSESGTPYDILVTVNADSYKLTPAPLTPAPGAEMNNFKVPDISMMDQLVNGMFFSDIWLDGSTNVPITTNAELKNLYSTAKAVTSLGQAVLTDYESLDRKAVNYFLGKADEYADAKFEAYYRQKQEEAYRDAIKNGTTPPPFSNNIPDRSTEAAYANPDYCRTDSLLRWITRTTEINISGIDDSGTYKTIISYKIIYRCDWSKSSEAVSNLEDSWSSDIIPESLGEYSGLVHQAYLYYQPSIFHQYYIDHDLSNAASHPDILKISNTSGHMMDFYLVRMSEGITPSVNTAEVVDPSDSSLMIYKPLEVGAATSYSYNDTDIIHYEPSLMLYKNYTGSSDSLRLHTNINKDHILEYVNGTLATSPDVNEKIIEEAPDNRIYSVTVQVYEYSGADDLAGKYTDSKLLYTLDSNREK